MAPSPRAKVIAVRIVGALGGKECGCKQKWVVEVADRGSSAGGT